jgi:NAD(P)H dehydrogenase (quinone)
LDQSTHGSIPIVKRQVAIVYHSNMGHTERLARAVAAGASSVDGVSALLISVTEAQSRIEDLNASDAIIFGAPTFMGSVSAEMKTFMDSTSKTVYLQQSWKDKIAAGFTNSGAWSGDKLLSLFQIVAFAAQHSMIWASLGLMAGHNRSSGSADDLNRCGVWLGATAQSNIDASPDLMPLNSDLCTGEHLGRRVAQLSMRFSSVGKT